MKRELGICRLLAAASCLSVILLPTMAVAHPGVDFHNHEASFVGGLLHPMLGLDHLVAMMTVGLWTAYLGGRALIAVPLVFVGMMIMGAAFGANGFHLPAADQTIAASLVVFGLMICMLVKLPVGVAAAIAGLFSTFHGYAHGSEIPAIAQPLPYSAGFIFATVLLLAIGVAIGRASRQSIPDLVVRGAGAAVAIFGVLTAIGTV